MTAYRERLEVFLDQWDAGDREEVRAAVGRFVADLIGAFPERSKVAA